MPRLITRSFGLLSLLLGCALSGFALLHWLLPGQDFRWQFLLGIPLYLIFIGYGWSRLQDYAQANELALPADDPDLERATRLARQHRAQLVAALEERRSDCHVKLGLETAQGEIEHIWCSVHELVDGQLVVSLDNQPLGDLSAYGGRFRQPLERIEDFIVLRPDGSALGGYSVMAIAQHLLRRGRRLHPRHRALLRAHSAYREWPWEGAEP